MTRGVRRVAAVLLLVAPTAVLLLASAVPDAYACPSNASLSLSPAQVKAGQRITVVGSAFICNAVSTGGEAPLTHIAVTFVQGSVSQTVAAIDTGSQDPFKVVVTVPADARAGSAFIEAAAGSRTARAPMTVVAPLARTGAPTIEIWLVGSMMVVLGLFGRVLDLIWA
jgi:hypothetical protein